MKKTVLVLEETFRSGDIGERKTRLRKKLEQYILDELARTAFPGAQR